jgi:hypothetical protein
MLEEPLPLVDHTVRDYRSLRAALLRLAETEMPEWTDRSPGDFGVLLLELFAYVGDVLLHYQDRIAEEAFPDTAVERRSVVDLLRLVGYELAPAHPARADLTLQLRRSPGGRAVVPHGATFSGKAADGSTVRFAYPGEDLTIDLTPPPDAPVDAPSDALVTLRLPVEQTDRDVAREVLGSSDGSAWQRFRLPDPGVVESSVLVRVGEGAAEPRWLVRPSLADSSPGDRHVTLHRAADGLVAVEFGDGRTGRIPPRGTGNILAAYRTGGGTRGNVAAGAIDTAETALGDALVAVRNETPAAGGTEPEDLATARMRAAGLFRANDRAVTAADVEHLALRFGLGRVATVPTAWNRLTVYVAPVGGGPPPDTLLDDLRRYLDDRRMLSCPIDVAPATDVTVAVDADWGAEPGADVERAERRVEDAVRALLAPDAVAFGRPLYLSKVYEAVESVPEVRFVDVTLFRRDPRPDTDPTPPVLRFRPDELPRAAYPAGIRLTYRGESSP